ncbi:di-heme-cytochrome C peroxidase [Marinicellulosiphila megalodicopiae]|uniref:di-heme-cytochrome C peroxidase n=1 Tax=Marinicellulosiphila megalodicopiae TaxID=2724896 RepID=UPI003BAE6101
MATFFQSIFAAIFYLLKYSGRIVGVIILLMVIALIAGKTYQNWDDDPDRGAIALENGEFGESFTTPVYLDQGWTEAESLWFYNTTQGSALMPYDLFMSLEQENSNKLLRDNHNIDKYRYLPQKETFLNPDGLPVGLVKDTYQGNDYIGYTCAACHTNQVNFTKDGITSAIRIDGGPAMADMVGFLTAIEKSMRATLADEAKKTRYVETVLARNNDFKKEAKVIESTEQWLKTISLYNTVNHSHIDYGYGRLDAFGRIYNRVLQHMINKQQLANTMEMVTAPGTNGERRRVLTRDQIDLVLEGVNENIIVDKQFGLVLDRLASTEPGYPGLNQRDLLRVRNSIFNEPNAPVSYPFLWDIGQADYTQWNGVANNAGVGPLGRNTGEVIGVFGILDWTSHEPNGFELSTLITDQKNKNEVVNFKSSIDVTNLRRLEAQLKRLQSPVWPQEILGEIDQVKAERGQLVYAQYCQSCHEVVDRNNADRIIIANMMDINLVGTDKAAAINGVMATGKSGNFQHTVQSITGVGDVFISEDAPVLQILTSATKGVIATPDPDKFFIRRWLDRLYVLGSSFFENKMPETVKKGNYVADTTSNPYSSLLAYKGRALNGIWATAPYLHNGSVPTLYDLLLPKKLDTDPAEGEYRPDEFVVGSREFDANRVGFKSKDYDGSAFITTRVGDMNTGHEYGAGKTAQNNGEVLPALSEKERWDLIEYLKTL